MYLLAKKNQALAKNQEWFGEGHHQITHGKGNSGGRQAIHLAERR